MELSSSAYVTVPHGWQRLIEKKEVIYVSPNQSCMRNRDEVVRYLSSPSTCKCGLKCPFSFDEHFNFDSNVLGLPDSRPFTGYSDCHLLPNLYIDNKSNRGKAKARKTTATSSGKTKPGPPPMPKAGPTKSAKAHQPVIRPTKGHPVIKPMTIPLMSALAKGLNISAKGTKTDQQLVLTAPNYPLMDFQALIDQLSAASKSSSTMTATLSSPSVSIGPIQLNTTTTKLPAATSTTSKTTCPNPKPSTTTTTVLSAVPSSVVVNIPDIPPQNQVITDEGQKRDGLGSNDRPPFIVSPLSTESDLLNLLHNMDDQSSPVTDAPLTTPTKIQVSSQNVHSTAPPTQCVTTPTQSVTPPTQSLTPLTQSVTFPTQSVTTPTHSLTPPTQSVTPPTHSVIPITQSVTPPTQSVTTPTHPLTPPTQSITPPTHSVIPITQSVTTPTHPLTPPTQSITPPTQSITPPTQSVSPPTQSVSPPTQSVTTPTKYPTPPTHIVAPTKYVTQNIPKDSPPCPSKTTPTPEPSQATPSHISNETKEDGLVTNDDPVPMETNTEGDKTIQCSPHARSTTPLSTSLETQENNNACNNNGIHNGVHSFPAYKEYNFRKRSQSSNGHKENQPVVKKRKKQLLVEEGNGKGWESTKGYNLRNQRSASCSDKLLSGDDLDDKAEEEFVMEDDSVCISESLIPQATPTQAPPTPPDINENSSVTSDHEMHDLSSGTLENEDKDNSTESATGGIEGSSLFPDPSPLLPDPSPLSSDPSQGIMIDNEKLPHPAESTPMLFVPATLVQLATAAYRELNEEVWPNEDSRETSRRLSTGSESASDNGPVEQCFSGYTDNDTDTLSLLVCIPFKCLPNRVYMRCYSPSSFNIGDVVWAKAAGLAGWPGKIIKHTNWTLNKLQCPPAKHMWIRWYNHGSVSLVKEDQLKPLFVGCGQGKSKRKKKLEIAIKEAVCEYRERQEQCLQF